MSWTESEVAAVPGHATAASWLRLLRPRQWLKNILVVAAPVAAGAGPEADVAAGVAAAFVAFSLTASATYLVNDVADADRDRAHPLKRTRPVAAGAVSPTAAVVGAVLLGAGGLGVAAWWNGELALVVGIYLVLTLAYSFGLKHVPVLDLLVVAAGFVLRAVAGGMAVDLPLSSWFLLVTSFGALFVVTGKRHSETLTLAGTATDHRPSLDGYPPAFLPLVLGVSVGLTLISYCLWAFEVPSPGLSELAMTLSIAPFLAAVLRYALVVMAGRAGEPEEVFLHDRPLQLAAVVWAGVFALGIYGG